MQNTDTNSSRRGAIFFIAMLSFFQIIMGVLLIAGEGGKPNGASDNNMANIVVTDIRHLR